MPQDPQVTLDALDELVEVFVGLSRELEWSTSEDISRKELLPIFVMCSRGTLNPEQALDVVMSNILVKRDETFAVLLKIVQRLNRQLSEYNLVRKSPMTEESSSMTDNGEEPV
jgi:polyhydroxyalkanoate synthesis regulator phasin